MPTGQVHTCKVCHRNTDWRLYIHSQITPWSYVNVSDVGQDQYGLDAQKKISRSTWAGGFFSLIWSNQICNFKGFCVFFFNSILYLWSSENSWARKHFAPKCQWPWKWSWFVKHSLLKPHIKLWLTSKMHFFLLSTKHFVSNPYINPLWRRSLQGLCEQESWSQIEINVEASYWH